MILNEDNLRILLLAFFLSIYVLIGGLIIRFFESPVEDQLVKSYQEIYLSLEKKLENGTATINDMREVIYSYGNLTSHGLHRTKVWDLIGSLHFVVTIISTIGYGSYAPNTVAGKIFVIIYGLLGCSGGTLFLNLVLERMVTFLAYILRIVYIKKLVRNGDDLNNMKNFDTWKPSVYWVMTCLLIMSVLVAGFSIGVYSFLENWTVIESAYFCFVSFSTIGFGDFIPLQNELYYPYQILYFLTEMLILVVGCSCVYSLMNVISIVLKQLLNTIIPYIDYEYLFKSKDDPDRVLRRYSIKMQRERYKRRKSSVTTLQKVMRKNKIPFSSMEARSSVCNNLTGPGDEFSSADIRKLSDGMISLRDFLTSNQVTLAMMQKELYDTAQGRGGEPPQDTTRRFIPGTIGPLAILCNKLGGNR